MIVHLVSMIKVFRNQAKDIFRHIVRQCVSNDADLVWEDMTDDELRKDAQIKEVVINRTSCLLESC